MIKYRENRNDIIQRVEIDLTEIPAQSRGNLESKITKYLKNIDKKYRHIFRFEPGNKFVYETEVLTPKVNKNRLNILMVLGNPAVHSVAERMFFSYEKTGVKGKWREHRFWRALRDCGILEFDRELGNPTCENIEKINACKRDWLLNGKYESKFNVFLLPYFSFPTPASREYNGVPGITKIVGKEIFKEMKKFEFQRFESIVLGNDIKNVICFQKTDAGKEIIQKAEDKPIGNILKPNYPIYKLGGSLEHVILYRAPPTRRLHIQEAKEILSGIICDIINRIGRPSPNGVFYSQGEFKRGFAPLI